MSEPTLEPRPELGAYLVDSTLSVVVAEVVGLRNVVEAEGDVESGLIDFRVARVLRGEVPGKDASVAIPFTRALDPLRGPARAWSPWDETPLSVGARALLAVAPTRARDVAIALGVEGLAVAADERIELAGRCLRALRLGEPARQDELAQLLSHGDRIASSFALAAVRASFARTEAAAILEVAVRSRRTAPGTEQAIASELARAELPPGTPFYFQPDRGADRTNARVVGLIAVGLANSGPGPVRDAWLEAARATLTERLGDASEDARVRRALLTLQPPATVDALRRTLQQLSTTGHASVRGVALRVLDAVRA